MNPILFEIKGSIATITLNRPEKFNAFNTEMASTFKETLDKCEKDNSIRCVQITGAGKAFSAGQDLSEVIDPNGPGLKKILSENYNPIVKRIRNLSKPVVAVVNGVAAGAGANIALCCDVVIAAASASFIQAFSKIGLIPDSGGTYFLPRLVGFQKASAIMMLGDRIMAPEAEKIGMIYKFFPDEIFYNEAEKIVFTLSQLPTRGLALTKQALNFSLEKKFDQQLEIEDELQQEAGATKDFNEGVNAFIEKRNPQFIGS